MQAVLTSSIKEMKNDMAQLNYLFEQLDSADNTAKSVIENEIVSFGEDAVDFLIDKLTGLKGAKRGIAAMSLIRIGECAISPLKQLALTNKNFSWVANYIIKEIEGEI